jgi:hypothetical protein
MPADHKYNKEVKCCMLEHEKIYNKTTMLSTGLVRVGRTDNGAVEGKSLRLNIECKAKL